MVRSGRAGGREGLENTRVHGAVHVAVPEVARAKDLSVQDSVRRGSVSTNRSVSLSKPPEVK